MRFREAYSKDEQKADGMRSDKRKFLPELLRRLMLIAAFYWLASTTPLASAQTAQADVACSSAITTAAMLSCESARYEKSTQNLQSLYQKLASHLDSLGKQKLRTAQAAWIRFRDANANFEADAARGGSLAGVIKLTVLADMTESRAAELQKDVQQRLPAR